MVMGMPSSSNERYCTTVRWTAYLALGFRLPKFWRDIVSVCWTVKLAWSLVARTVPPAGDWGVADGWAVGAKAVGTTGRWTWKYQTAATAAITSTNSPAEISRAVRRRSGLAGRDQS